MSRLVAPRASLVIGFGLAALDRWLKIVAFDRRGIGSDGPFFTYFENDRLFGLIKLNHGTQLGVSAVILSLVVGLMIFAKRRNAVNMYWGSLLILLGGISNLIDRLVAGSVVDYLRLSVHLPIFNLADVSIFAGSLILIGAMMRVETSQVDRHPRST